MITKEHLTGVVLAGGRSSRFGSDKAVERMGGETFLMRAIELLRPLCAEVLISGLKLAYAETGCRMLKDEYEGCGPLGGIHAALKGCATDYVLFLTCDMPLMEQAPLLHMLAESAAPVVGWRLHQRGGGVFPLLVSTTLVAEVEQALQQGMYRVGHSLCQGSGARMLEIPDRWASCFTNINRKEDLHCILT